MDDKANIQHNKLMKLENVMSMYGVYNAETLEKLIYTVHDIHNTPSSHERSFAGEHSPSVFLNSLCTFFRLMALFNKFTFVFKNNTRQIHSII